MCECACISQSFHACGSDMLLVNLYVAYMIILTLRDDTTHSCENAYSSAHFPHPPHAIPGTFGSTIAYTVRSTHVVPCQHSLPPHTDTHT